MLFAGWQVCIVKNCDWGLEMLQHFQPKVTVLYGQTLSRKVIWLIISAVQIFPTLITVTVTFASEFFFPWEVIYRLKVGPYSQTCDLGLENAAWEKQGFTRSAELQTAKETLTTSKHPIEFTYTATFLPI